MKTFARTLAGLGLAAAITIGLAGTANAAPADRSGDAVVLKGSDLGDLVGTEPGKIVGFAWNGRWEQIPVQVDERHTIDVRQLYPEGDFPPYVGGNAPDFDLEVYADPTTRAGADEDATFDADDELTFMGGDAGGTAPSVGSVPSGTDRSSAVKVDVDDPVGGGSAYVYLFKAAGDLDPSAGKDYVDYDFKLTNLTGSQTLKDDYGYFSQFNPEDSTVKTDDYELHSIDRWMEDQMKITMGNSTGVDILDREVAQATKTGCGRSEYTFSGRWKQDSTPGNDSSTDNEGTYIAVIDGPVRAIRSYMGANSGPYVQREHIYYQDHEQNTIFLRVHPMLDLYAWTDYSPAAIGMTYRDLKNTGGVPVDGNPDSIVPATTADVANGAYAWQQLSGPQGSVSTVVGSDTDIPNPNFGTYYLDDSTPTGANEVQCGGDGQSIGASGFGILGPVTPNTDPRLGNHHDLTVKRTRYFGPPSDGATQAENYTERVSKPLIASATASPIKSGHARIKVKLLNKRVKARPGKQVRLKLRVINNGALVIQKGTFCLTSKRGLAKKACKKIGALKLGKGRTVTVKAKVKKRVKGKRLHLNLGYTVRAESGTVAGGQPGGFNIGIRRKK